MATKKQPNVKPIVRIYLAVDGHMTGIEASQPITVIIEYDSIAGTPAARHQRYAVTTLEATNSDVGSTAKYIATIHTSAAGQQEFAHGAVIWKFKRSTGQWHAYHEHGPLPLTTPDNKFPTAEILESAQALVRMLTVRTAPAAADDPPAPPAP